MSKYSNIDRNRWLMPQEKIEPIVDAYNKAIQAGKNQVSIKELNEAKDGHLSIKLISANEMGAIQEEQLEKNAINVGVMSTGKNQNGKVAIIDLHGSFFTRYDWFVYYYGGVAMDLVGQVLDMIEKDPGIDGVVFNIDSNGGALAGTEALGKRIAKFTKPIGAFVENSCHSAAYWVASQCDFILTASQTTYLGNIGVMMRHINREKQYESFGLDVTYISAPQSVKKITAPDNQQISEEDLNDLLNMLRQDCSVFINAVKKGRGDKIDIDAVSNGQIFNSQNASRLGLHDGLAKNGIMDAVRKVIKLKNDSSNSSNSNKKTMADYKNIGLEVSTLSLGQIGNKRVIVPIQKLTELNEKFEGASLGELETTASETLELNFEALGISAKKATMTNVLLLNKNTHCLVDSEKLAALNALVASEQADEATVEQTETEDISSEASKEVNESSNDTEQDQDQANAEGSDNTTEAQVKQDEQSASEQADEATVEQTETEDKLAKIMANMQAMMASMETMTQQANELKANNDALVSKLNEAEAAKQTAEERSEKIIQNAKKIEKKYNTKVVLTPEPENQPAGEKIEYKLGSNPDVRRTMAVSIAQGIIKARCLNKNGAIYKEENKMQLGS